MEFFTKEDFEYYASVINDKVTSKSPNWLDVRHQLTKRGVFAKTGFWAKQFRDRGYKVEFRNDCQFSGKLRHYTWAKIYLKGQENTNVFFTIGVGSRLQENTRVFDLVYKLDCQRKRGEISPHQIDIFDNYIKENVLNNSHVRFIGQGQLINNTWESLFNKTKEFINDFETHYKNAVGLVWPNGVGISPKVARLCWNDNDWETPSGSNGKSKNKDITFESRGYGHEEWLFNIDRVIDGYHYGFIQAFNDVPKHIGKTYDVHVFSIKGNDSYKDKSEYYWIGRINKAEVLTKTQREETLQIYKDKGWYQEMLNELVEVNVLERDLQIVDEEDLFNIRFKADNDHFTRFENYDPIKDPAQEIGKGMHYVLMDLITETKSVIKSSRKYRFRPGHNPTKTGTSKSKHKAKTVNRTLKHKVIQELMFNQLVKEYDEDSVGTEVSTGSGTSIDVVVVQPDKSEWFYEVKTYNQPLICIREAFGQIIEYAMFSKNNHADKLIVVGVNKPSNSEIEYLNHLRQTTGLSIYYQVFDLIIKKLKQKLY
jgi:hypothetical protein